MTAAVATTELASASAAHHGWRQLAELAALMGFASVSTDLYGLPYPGALYAGTGAVEWTISGYLIGFSSSQLVWGPIGDRFGRRWPVAAGLVLFVICSAGWRAIFWILVGVGAATLSALFTLPEALTPGGVAPRRWGGRCSATVPRYATRRCWLTSARASFSAAASSPSWPDRRLPT